MSSNNKRCSSGVSSTSQTQSPTSFKQHPALSRSKTCGFTSPTALKPKPERLEPLATNKTSQLNNETLVNVSFFSSLFFFQNYLIRIA